MADSEDEETPPERDVKDFNFKQMRKIRMFESPTSLPNPRSSLLAVSTKYGLTFVGCPTGIKVIKTEAIERINESDEGSMQNIVGHCPSSFIQIGHSVRFVGLSSDDLTLSVCCEKENQTVMVLYDVPTLGSSNPSTAKFGETTLTSDAGVSVRNVLWNPGFPGIFAVCLSSGSVAVMELTEMEIKALATLPGSVKANAICWSPKGKQLVVGHRDGRLTQYSQALEVKKEIECPEVFVDDPHSVTDLLWITATLLAAVYSSFDEGDTPKFQLISVPKNEQRTITNFDDIYYVMSEEREPMYYLKNIAEWSMIVSACSNGYESAVIGKYGGETTTPWEKWNFEETGRAEMPLTNNNDETFPMGLAFDFSSTRPVIEGEKRLPPAPIMMLLSTDGVLCPFYMVNQTPNSDHSIVRPVEPLPLGGQRKAIIAASNAGPLSTGTPGLAPKERVPSAPRTAGDLPAGAFAFVGTKQAFSSAPGPFSSGLSFASSKQPVSFSSETPTSATPASTPASTFLFASSKQNVPLSSNAPSSGISGDLPAGVFSFGNSKQTMSSSGNAPTSAFLSTNQKQPGLTASFKLPTQTQIPATESGRPLAGSPQIVKPTPSSQTQSVTPRLSSFQTPLLTTTSTVRGEDKPKPSSSVPSQSTGKEFLAQPKPTLAKAAGTKAPLTRQDVYKEECSSSPELKPTPQGFRLPGQSIPTESVKQEPTRKATPATKGNVIEASVSENIQEAISHFNTEMAKLCDNVKIMQRNCCLIDDNKDLNSLRKRTEDVASKLTEIKRATKDQHKDIDDEKRKLFEAFEMLEDARIRQAKKSDPRYVQLLKSRTLDPVNTSKMRDIRNHHLYLDKTLREVNMVLDEQWNKENERKRSIQRPALDEVYHTLKVHHRIAQDQAVKLDQITQEMKNRKLLSTSWQRSPLNTTSLRDDLSSVRNPFVVSKQELKSPLKNASAQKISPQKQAQLRSMLQKRRSTPVRRSRVVPTTVAKTPLVKPSGPEVSFLSSTPAVRQEDTAEASKGRFSFGDVPEEIKVSDDDGSLAEDGCHEEEPSQKSELEHLDADHKASASGPDPSPVQSDATTSTTSGFSLGNTVDEAAFKKPSHPVKITAAVESSHAKPIPKPNVVGAFSTVDKSVGGGIKPPGSQPAKAEQTLEPSGLFLPATKAESTTAAPIQVKSDFVPSVKVISTETPPNIAAAMAAMSRASASQSAAQSGSNLDLSASIEPVTLVTYKPQAQGGAQPKDYDSENIAAKAIANAALMAATAEARKSSTKPQCSTEFIFKSSDNSKPGPPVVTFKPPTSPPQIPASASKVTAAPNVTVNPTPVFKPAFAPAVPNASTASNTGGLQKTFTGPQSVGSFSFAPPNGGLPSFMASSVAASSTTSAFSFSSKAKDTGSSQTAAASVVAPSAAKPGNVITAPTVVTAPTAGTTPTVGITPSARVSRNLFAAGESSSAAAATSGEQDVKQEGKKEVLKAQQVTTANPSIASSSGIATPATITQGFPFSAPTAAGEGFFKNLNLSTATIAGNVFGSGGDTSGNPPSILSSLMRASTPGGAAGNTSNLFGMAPTAVSNAPAPTSSTIPGQVSLPSKGTPSENKDTSVTPSGFPVSTSAGGIFSQVLSESSKSNMESSTTATKTLPVPGSIFSAPATTPAFPPGGLLDLSLGGAKSSTTTSSTTAVAANPLSLPAGTASAFSATNTASPFFPSITPASTSASAPAGGSPLTSLPPPTITTTITSPSSKDSSTSAASAGGLFSKVSTTASPFGAQGTVSSGAGSVGASVTTTTGNLFATPTSTAFASTSLFGASTGSTFGTSPAPFSSPASSQGSAFGSTPIFGSSNTTAGTGSGFGAPASVGFSTASKPAENALGFGFGGFGLGGQASSQANKTNPFGASQGFGVATTSQSSLFGGKSGADVFKMTDSPKPVFGSNLFSQSGFGTQSSGGFSGGSFSTQGGSVAASGFGFGASSPSGTAGFGSPQPFGSPSAGGSVFGGAPSFGSVPSFGGAPAFGNSPQGGLVASPSSGVFGSGQSGGFGQSQGSPTFGALATQSNLPSFGAVAGMPQTQGFGGIQQQTPPSFGSFGGGGGGGGSQNPSGASFSQWR